MNILYLNDYSISRTYAGVAAGVDHAAHLWGYDHFIKSHNVQIAVINNKMLAWQKKTLLNKVLGDMYQEAQVIRGRAKIDLVIAANLFLVNGLGYAKMLMKLPPVIAILHSLPHSRKPGYKFFIRNQLIRLERIVCIARKDYNFLTGELGFSPHKVRYITWAANPGDYDRLNTQPPEPSGKKYILSMGKSDRDYKTLTEAFARLNRADIQLKIYTGGSGFKNPGYPNIEVVENFINFKDSIKVYNNCEFVVVPLIKSDRTLGLTSMFDALAMKKALLITRNPGIDIDFEKERMGLWAEPYDVQGMKEKMLFLLEHPDISREFGENGKRYLDQSYNYAEFCRQLEAVAEDAHQENLDKKKK